MNILNESLAVIQQDNTYRRQGKHIIIAQIESLIPKGYTVDPSIYGGGSSEYTWGKMQKFFSHYPGSRNSLMPSHYYCEYIDDDYQVFVGCPLSNKSWFLQEAVSVGVIPIQYLDAILIVLQESYSLENIDKRLWKVLSNTTLSPLMRMLDIPKERVVFFEKLANEEMVNSIKWNYRWSKPTFLDPIQLQMVLKEYEKR
jgi:hypothetical protein